ncbi:MAG TPA: lasso peptide biosynthesis B2 protein [Candidatus Angelobacter sp.]|nr:lasso peptide biosynthesis B2 protein [Candidatus Angelobacter sp.]
MKKAKHIWLVIRALYEIARHDAVLRLRGSGRTLQQVSRQSVAAKSTSPELEQAICDAVLLATCLYWKPVLCLQRSVCTARLLRKHGVNARLVIGYRPAPFFAHAWVEVEGRVVYGSPAYQKRLQPIFIG